MCDSTGRERSEAELGRLAVGRVSMIQTRIFLNTTSPCQSSERNSWKEFTDQVILVDGHLSEGRHLHEGNKHSRSCFC